MSEEWSEMVNRCIREHVQLFILISISLLLSVTTLRLIRSCSTRSKNMFTIVIIVH
jgi:hypothetical protein